MERPDSRGSFTVPDQRDGDSAGRSRPPAAGLGFRVPGLEPAPVSRPSSFLAAPHREVGGTRTQTPVPSLRCAQRALPETEPPHTPRITGQAARRLLRVPTAMPRPRAARPPRRCPALTAEKPKGLSRPRGGRCPPRARPVLRRPAPARTRPPVTCGRLRAPPPPGRSLPGAAPQPAPSARRRAPCWLLRRGPGRWGVGRLPYISIPACVTCLLQPMVARKGGDWAGHASVLLLA